MSTSQTKANDGKACPPLVSIVVATYNRRDLVGRTLTSALNQSLRDLEVVVSDDGSTDGTRQILAGIADPRLRVHFHAANVGVWANWATALRMAGGRYIVFLGDDDELTLNFIFQLSSFLDSSPDVSVAFSDLRMVSIAGELLHKISAPHRADNRHPPMDVIMAILGSRIFFGAAMFRREQCLTIWEQCSPDGLVADWGLILRLAQLPGFVAASVPDAEYIKTSHSSQLGSTQGGDVLRLLAELCERLAHQGPDGDLSRLLRAESLLYRIGYCRHLARIGDITGCRSRLWSLVQQRPASLLAWSQFLQSVFCPWRVAAAPDSNS
jgi:glycosyltransferase involved in cell wall biosynthesis